MAERANEPGPGRSTSEAAFNELKKGIAERNAAAHRTAKKRREPRVQELIERKRQADLR